MPKRILILGGTAEARQLARALLEQGHAVVTSYAGVTQRPNLPVGETRVGGFGGADGLAAYIASAGIALIIDATHAFALQIAEHAHAAAARQGIGLLRLERPAWTQPDDGVWQSFPDFASAFAAVPDGATVLLTTGRKNLGVLQSRPGVKGVVRCIEAPELPLPAGWELLLQRPPFTPEQELALLKDRRISHLLTKNAGGRAMGSKLQAAMMLGIAILMIERPVKPSCPSFQSVDDLVRAVGRFEIPR